MAPRIQGAYLGPMKSTLHRLLLLAFPLAASSFLASCAVYDHPSAGHHPSSGSGYATFHTLPSDYSGDAYYYNDQYYAGGRYEPGTYSHQGRTYNHRYYHDGRYLYGGDLRQASSTSYRNQPVRSSTSTRYVTYQTLPRDHTGDAYYYNDRYYAGGRFEPGNYTHQGRSYENRYFHNGQYLYGGDYRQSASAASTRSTIQRSGPIHRTSVQRASF